MQPRRITRRSAIAAGVATAIMPIRALAARQSAHAYRAIRYARAERFSPAVLEPFRESLIQKERGPIAPQLPGGLSISIGPQSPNRQQEDCQVLSIFTPSRHGHRPVVIFLHGGGFATGGGELAWYDGHRLAAEQDVVVVPVTYRLGALGFWLPNGSSGLSPAYSDMVTSLQWVQKYIDQFGGDPANVTLAGQSAGCCAAMELTDLGFGGKLYQRVIAMSGGRVSGTREEAEERSRVFDRILGTDPHTAPVEVMRNAYARLPRSSPVLGDRKPFWLPVASDKRAPINIDVMAGWAREDYAAHVLLAEGRKPIPGTSLQSFRDATRPMREELTAYARDAAAAGQKAYLYSFDWNGPDTGLGNCHCIDLAFLYGDWEAWKNAPMLAGVDRREYERMGHRMRAQWATFARSGRPTISDGGKWVPVTTAEAPVASLS